MARKADQRRWKPLTQPSSDQAESTVKLVGNDVRQEKLTVRIPDA